MKYIKELRNKLLLKIPYLKEIFKDRNKLRIKVINQHKQLHSCEKEISELNNKLKKREVINKHLIQKNIEYKNFYNKYIIFSSGLNLEDLNFSRLSFSQEGEDLLLLAFFEGEPDYKGFYLDIGAFHPLRFSNTQILYNHGWKGINIDATPGSMNLFEKYRSKDINIEAAISVNDDNKLAETYYMFEEPALNSFNKELSNERIKLGYKLIKKQKIPIVNINHILSKHKEEFKQIDVLSIDIEGLDFRVLESLNFELFSPRYILFEDLDVVDKDIKYSLDTKEYKFLKRLGYILLAKTRRTLIFKKL